MGGNQRDSTARAAPPARLRAQRERPERTFCACTAGCRQMNRDRWVARVGAAEVSDELQLVARLPTSVGARATRPRLGATRNATRSASLARALEALDSSQDPLHAGQARVTACSSEVRGRIPKPGGANSNLAGGIEQTACNWYLSLVGVHREKGRGTRGVNSGANALFAGAHRRFQRGDTPL